MRCMLGVQLKPPRKPKSMQNGQCNLKGLILLELNWKRAEGIFPFPARVSGKRNF